MQQHYFPSPTDLLPPPFLSLWLYVAGRGTTRDRRLILSRVNRRDRFRVPARREAAARYWSRFFHVLHASVQLREIGRMVEDGGSGIGFLSSLLSLFLWNYKYFYLIKGLWKEFFDIIGKVSLNNIFFCFSILVSISKIRKKQFFSICNVFLKIFVNI